MKKIIIPIHSFIDVVTNSSTSIYVGCHDNTINYAKDLINDLLKVAGSDKTADDLFVFKVLANKDNEMDEIFENLEEYYPDVNFDEISSDENKKLADKVFYDICEGNISPLHDWGKSYNGYDTRSLILESKNNDKLTIDLGSRIERIFLIDGEYNG